AHANLPSFPTRRSSDLETIDEIAERVRSIGHYAVGTMKEFLALSQLTETGYQKNDALGYIKELLADYEAIIAYIREQIDVVADRSEEHTSELQSRENLV